MYISIGHEAVIKASELVAIIDYDIYCVSELDRQMKLTPTADDIQCDEEARKSVVITTDQMYFSPLSAATLQKRLSFTHQNKLNGMFD
ncbi:MAG: extracellular matrix regulator RemB [Bacillus sp. (in: firmicutes)]